MSSFILFVQSDKTHIVQFSVTCMCIYIYIYIYRVSQEECARLREGVPYAKLYRYNPKHQVQSGTVTEIMAREKCGLLAGPRTVPVG